MTASDVLQKWKKQLTRSLGRMVELNWGNVGLRGKMGAIVGVGLVGLLVTFALLGISTTRQVTRQVLNERVALARLRADNLDAALRHIESLLTITAGQEILADPQAAPSKRAAALRTASDLLAASDTEILLLDATGRLQTSVTEAVDGLDWSRVPAVSTVLAGEPAGLSVVSEDSPWAVIVVPVIDKRTAVPIGALAALVDLTVPGLLGPEHLLDPAQAGTFEVVDANGLVLMSSRPDRVLTLSDQAARLRELSLPGEPCVGCETAGSLESNGQTTAFAAMRQAPWVVIVYQDSAAAFAPTNRLTLLTVLLGLAAIAGALGLVWVTTNSVVAPVQLLTEAARRIAGGDLTTPICCWRGDEIGELAESFDAMRAQLKSSMDEIQAWNHELDARVQDRTQAARTAQLEAQRARDDLRAIIDGLSDELIVVGLDRRIQQMNKKAEAQYKLGEEIVGQPCYRLFNGDGTCRPPGGECPIPLVLDTGEPVKVTHIHHDSDNGEERYLNIVASPMRDSTGRITRIIELIRDVTDEKKIEQSLVRRHQQLSILNVVATTVNQSLELEDILGKALDEVLRLAGVDIGAIFLQEEVLGKLELLAHRGLSEEAARMASKLGMLDGACGGIIEAGQVIVVPDLSRYRGRRAESLKREKLSTLVHVPLAAKGCILGSMCVGTRRQCEFDPEEQELLTAIGNQITVAIENARLYAEVQQKERLRGQLLNKLITAQEEERKRIARELHDDTSQALTALLFAVEEVLEMNDLDEMKAKLGGTKELAMHTLDGIHNLIFDLRPTMLDHLGLIPALRWFAQSRLEPVGVSVTINEPSPTRRLPAEIETALFRVVQEVITNIARHAAARKVVISFRFDSETAAITVEDDGIGFDMFEVTLGPDTQRGLGLMGMFERVELLGGDMEIDAAPGDGTHIHIQVPVSGEEVVNA